MIHTINIRKRLTKEEYIHIKETYNLLPDINCFKHVPKTRLNLPNDSEKYISISVFEYHAHNMRITYYINAFLDLHKIFRWQLKILMILYAQSLEKII